MKVILPIIFLSHLSFFALAQVKFERGYLVDSSGVKKECYIRNIDWIDNPDHVQYKDNLEAEIKISMVSSLREFGIYGYSIYQIAVVAVDESGTDLSKLDTKKSPEYTSKKLVLKVLVEGKATLYAYQKGNKGLYFFSVDGSEIQQLIRKQYMASQTQVGVNTMYLQQLWMNVRCEGTTEQNIKTVRYNEESLSKYFKKFNQCNGAEIAEAKETKNKGTFHLTIVPGAGFAQLSIPRTPSYDAVFKDKLAYQIGAYIEYNFSFHEKRWSVIAEPTYQKFSGETTTPSNQVEEADYSSIEVNMGARHFFNITTKSRIFLNALVCVDFSLSDNLTYLNLGTRNTVGWAAGAGITLGRISGEFRYYHKRDIVTKESPLVGDYSKGIFIIGFRIF